jgi:hypothetical protein
MDCGAPPAITYACEPIDVDAGGCVVANPDGGAPVAYPLECVSTQPFCSTFSNYTTPQTCECTTAAGMGPAFICPL